MRKTYRELKDEFERGISPETSKNSHNTNGSKTDFYNIVGCEDVDDLAAYWKLTFSEGNCLKAIVGIAKGRAGENRHSGTNTERDANKLMHYANRVKIELKKGNKQ